MAKPVEEKKPGFWERIVAPFSQKDKKKPAKEEPEVEAMAEPSVGPPDGG